MATPPDLYAILGVTPGADAQQIRATYRALMFRFHPDRNPSREAAQRARAINAAYAVLSDPEQRRRYDAQRTARMHEQAKARAWRPAPPPPDRRTAPSMPARRGGGGLAHPTQRTRRRIAGAVLALGALVLLRPLWLALAPAELLHGSAASANRGGVADADRAEAPPPAARAPEIAFKDIEAAATRYAATAAQGGFAAARGYSQGCHKAIEVAPGWSAADRCAAFDYAASSFSDAEASVANRSPDPYFSFTQINPGGLYRALSTDALAIDERLAQIRQAVIPVAMQAVWPDGPHDGDARPMAPAVAHGIPSLPMPRIAYGAPLPRSPAARPARPEPDDAAAPADAAPDMPEMPDQANANAQ